MRKLLFKTCIALIFLAIASCNHRDQPKSNQVRATPLTPTGKKITLNGIDSTTADLMINDFRKRKDRDSKPLSISVWYSNKTIHSIDSLLHAEIDAQKKAIPNRTDTTDGIRIYFASDPFVSTDQLNTSILLVSTFDSLKYPAGKSQHRDYYKHDAPFLNPILGEVSNSKNVPGALLFKISYKCKPEQTNCSLSPDHHITCEQAHSWVRNHGKIPINTISEWFDLKFFDELDREIHNPVNNPDGLRIYLAFRDKDNDHPSIINRHVFIFMTTKNVDSVHTDYFECYHLKSYVGDNGQLCPYNCN